ncbi:MAG: FAD-binding protein [Alphaproteobacteria bacterium]|nr:FAD-binding protein [Alphaproteobacteria bacterium]
MTEDDLAAALDWKGKPVRCRECEHLAINAAGLCAKGKACIRDRRARRVERFLRGNQELADHYLDHPYFEVRAGAARYANLFLLPPLLADPEAEVRAMATLRLPQERIKAMIHDPDTDVRIAAAARLTGRDLLPAIKDSAYMVRLTAVRRMPVEMLPLVRHDPDPEVRAWVARRIDFAALPDMCFDPDPLVRREVAARLPLAQLGLLLNDSDFRVRYAVAERIAEEDLVPLLSDPEEPIRELARERIAKVASQAKHLETESPAGRPAVSLNLGRDLAGSVATTLQTGLTADCTELAIDDEGSLAATRPTFGGSLLCTIFTLNFRPQMATVRPRVLEMPEPAPGRTGRIIEHDPKLVEADIITKVLDFIADRDSNMAALPYADIIVAGGLGLHSAENFQLVKQLAEVLGAEYGGSRPLVQKGWITADRQIGQTGKTVRPKLYIAAGISGAIQHRVGVEGADMIVAINTDPNAPIFEFAHLGIVADAVTLLPALPEAFAARLRINRLAS